MLPEVPEQRELERVGVLKLVHHQAVNARGEGCQRVRPLTDQPTRRRRHVRIVNQAGLLLGRPVVPVHVVGGQQQGLQVVARVPQGAWMRHQAVRGIPDPLRKDVILLRELATPLGQAQVAQSLP